MHQGPAAMIRRLALGAALGLILVLLPSMGVRAELLPGRTKADTFPARCPKAGLATHTLFKNILIFHNKGNHKSSIVLVFKSIPDRQWNFVINPRSKREFTIASHVRQKFQAAWNGIFIILEIKTNSTAKMNDYISGGRLSAIFADARYLDIPTIQQANIGARNDQIGAHLELAHAFGIGDGLLGYLVSPLRFVSSVLGFFDGVPGGFSGFSSLTQSEENQVHGDPGYDNADSRNNNHQHGPKRHVLLGLKIGLGALFFGLGVAGGVLSATRICTAGADRLGGRDNTYGHFLLWGGCLLGLASAVLSVGAIFCLFRWC
jgi:hypothetical protein